MSGISELSVMSEYLRVNLIIRAKIIGLIVPLGKTDESGLTESTFSPLVAGSGSDKI